MKKMLLLALCVLGITLVAGMALAKSGGFTGPGVAVSTVVEAKKMSDDAPIVLRGSIVRSLGKDHYEFKDATGTIEVEIDNDVWAGVTVGPDDIVELHGEVDKNLTSLRIDVDRVVKLQR